MISKEQQEINSCIFYCLKYEGGDLRDFFGNKLLDDCKKCEHFQDCQEIFQKHKKGILFPLK